MNLLSHIFPREWAMLPIEMIHAFSEYSSLPAYQCNVADVETHGRRIPLPEAQSKKFFFNAWQLAHAVKKADCARWPFPPILRTMSSVGFLLENASLFDWSSTELHLISGMSDFYADFSRTSLSGRIGQGMTLLFLEDSKYRYIGRFSNVYDNLLRKSKTIPSSYPDFVVENDRKEWALIEAKGSFVSPKIPSNIFHINVKQSLKRALKQLDGWDEYLSPKIHENFAMGTFLREIGGSHENSSIIAFVNTKPQIFPKAPRYPVDFLPDAVRRANYASWLSLMGFDDAARRLREREVGSKRCRVQLLTLGRRKYVVVIASIRPSYHRHAHDPDFLRLVRKEMFWPSNSWVDGVSVELIGLDLHVVRALQTTLQNRDSQALMNIELSEQSDIPDKFDGGEFHGSIFSDGSLIGEIIIPPFGLSDIERTEVML